MSESKTVQPVAVTAQERLHPAIRKLARACLALARPLAGSATPPTTSDGEPGPAAGQERRHD